MKILAVSDEECPALWDYYVPGRLEPYDLILACGDLKAAYLTFLVTMSHARLLYVHGNHDERVRGDALGGGKYATGLSSLLGGPLPLP